jgi:catechol 2,3-dioxygenase-like lactoylglutathione lyase family enzyme
VSHLYPAFLVSVLSLFALTAARAQEQVTRPPITGVASVQLFVTNVTNARDFYQKTLRLVPVTSGCDTQVAACLVVNDHQQVQLVAAPSRVPANLVAKIAFATTDIAQLRRYLVFKGLAPDLISVDANHGQHCSLQDPEGHVISFVQLPTSSASGGLPGQPSAKLIHAGFIVNDRQAEDHFYKDILGFHLYWQGGMKDGETSWVSMQVPDGTDWLEYMLNIAPDASHQTIGVMNHIALGVTDIKAAKGQLIKNGWKPTEEPQLGRDGKWQLNLYDPDDTRVEFMEFKPVEKPCCSEFTGRHPAP